MSKRADKLHLRLAETHEQKALEALQWRASLANPNDRPHLLANPDAIELPLDQILAGDVTVAEFDGRIVGFSAVVKGELDGLFVEPDLWRGGVGAALVAAARRLAKDRGLPLTVVANPAARGFYDRCGFKLDGETNTRFGPGHLMKL